MKITLFTYNKKRHNYLINLLSGFCDELFVLQSVERDFPHIIPNDLPESDVMKNYYKKVTDAQTKLFGNSDINNFQLQ